MKQLKKAGIWFLLLNKRFLKRYLFTAILLMVPLLVAGLRVISQEESGVLRVLLCQEKESVSGEIVQKLLDKNGIINYEEVKTKEEGYEQVGKGKADCLWVFPENIEEQICQFVQGNQDGVIKVYLKEDTVQTKLVREQLYGVLYPMLSYQLTNQFLQNQDELEYIDRKELQKNLGVYYEENQVKGSLLKFIYLDDAEYDRFREENNYMITPLRGILALLILLCGLSVTMFYMQDERNGIFQWMPIKKRSLFPILYILTGTLDAGIAAFLGLWLSGTFTVGIREIFIMGLYIMAIVLFCNLLRLFCGNIWAIGAAIPILLIVNLVLCPVFLNIRRFPVIQYLLPAYYYLNSVHSSSMLNKMMIYIFIELLLFVILVHLHEKNMKITKK